MMIAVERVVRAGVLGQNAAVKELLRLALTEDIGRGDLTTESTVAADATAVAEIVQKAPGVVCGLPIVALVFAELDPEVRVVALADEGSFADERRVVARIEGPARSVLSGERTAPPAAALGRGDGGVPRGGAGGRDRDDGARYAQDDAGAPDSGEVRGARRGCHNHRAGLDDGILIKENHIRAPGGSRRR
ncbi:MAG: hypothetical protein U0232_11005 [Thermomicrobiales bacterium]